LTFAASVVSTSAARMATVLCMSELRIVTMTSGCVPANHGTSDPRVQQFYTNPVIINDFKRYIKKLITHVNPYTGLSYANDATIFAYETGNELSGPIFRDMNVPNEWTVEISVSICSAFSMKLFLSWRSNL